LKFNDRRLDLLNVKYLVLSTSSPEFQRLHSSPRFSLAHKNGDVAALENKTVLPRAFLVPLKAVKVYPEIEDQLGLYRDPDFDPQQTFAVSQLPAVLKQPSEAAPASGLPLTNSVQVVRSRLNDVALRSAATGDSVLILSQTYYPGWKASIDGQPADLFPADMTLTGIRVPAGLHDVQVVFRPLSFKIGAALSIAAAVVLLTIALRPRNT
jgi:hypothetical protein